MRKANLYFTLVFILLITTIYVSRKEPRATATPLAQPLSRFPNRIDQWSGIDHDFDPAVLAKVGADQTLNREYRDCNVKAAPIWLYIGYYQSQTRGRQIHSPLHCYPGSGWNELSRRIVAVPLKNRTIRINRLILRKGSERRMVVYWYQMQDRVIANEYLQRVGLIMNAITKHRTDGALIRISMAMREGASRNSWKILQKFVRDLYPRLTEFFPQKIT